MLKESTMKMMEGVDNMKQGQTKKSKDDVIEELNGNIQELIYRIVSLEREKNKYYCCYPDKQCDHECDSNCDKCEREYYKKYTERLINEYTITEY